MTFIATPKQSHPPRYQHGFSLVELMISMVISLILLGGITALIVQQSQTRDELEKSSRQIENGRYAMQILHDDIQHAGFYGQYFVLATPPAAADPCLTDTASLIAAMPLAIQGYDSPAVSPLSCVPDTDFLPGTDILVIRRASTIPTKFDEVNVPPKTVVMLPEGLMYLQTNTSTFVMAAGDGTQGTTTTFPLLAAKANPPLIPKDIYAPVRPYWVHIYFVSRCSNDSCAGANDGIPTLKRMDLSATAGVTAFTVTPLVEGIESMQLDYGLDTLPADGYPDNYVATSGTTAAWADVMAVRVNLLARNTECTTGYVDNKVYGMGLTAQVNTCTNGGYKRHVFSELVRAVNPSGRRAVQ